MKIKRYFHIFNNFFKNNLMKDMEYRGNFIILSIFEVVWVVFQLIIIQLMFQYTNEIFGWTKYEIFFLMGFFRVTKGVIDTFVRPNFLLFPYEVTKGDLDLVLTKPVNSIFMISTRRQDFVEFSSAIAAVGIMIYAFPFLELTLGPTQILILLISSIASFIAFYSIFLIVTTTAIFIPRMTALRPFYDLLTNFARFPGQIFTQGRLAYEILLLPIFLVSTLPVQIILEKSPAYMLLFELIGTIILLMAAIKFWNFSLKRYSSASS